MNAMSELVEVSRDKFWLSIYGGELDVHPSIEGAYPYTSIFRFRNHVEHGRIVPQGDCWPYPEKYYLCKEKS